MTIRDDIKKIVAVAEYYYLQKLSKSEISKIMRISRQSVTNLLQIANDDGIVDIKIINPLASERHLANKLIELTGLRDVVVVQSNPIQIKRNIGLAGAVYLGDLIKPSQVIGVGWGKTLVETVTNIKCNDSPGSIVVPIMGGLGRVEYELQVNRISNLLANNIKGNSLQLFAPGVVGSRQVAESIMTTNDVLEVINYWDKLDLALIGLGGLNNISSGDIAPNGHMSFEEVENLNKLGVVGDVCLRFYNRSGENVKVTDKWYVIGITLEQLQKVPTVVCLAGGAEKVDAIQAAIKGGFIDILISDELVVQQIIANLSNK
ncbi:MAG TPA: sugar-binding domain-containing protein [Anaerolineaceae bacterium]|nr:DNA-binding transcriptional regulator [Leptolinea sp. HRD-7]HUM62583.1 sugar-binding domain-containing protein [Anaerolineaceae bacterium]